MSSFLIVALVSSLHKLVQPQHFERLTVMKMPINHTCAGSQVMLPEQDPLPKNGHTCSPLLAAGSLCKAAVEERDASLQGVHASVGRGTTGLYACSRGVWGTGCGVRLVYCLLCDFTPHPTNSVHLLQNGDTHACRCARACLPCLVGHVTGDQTGQHGISCEFDVC